MAHNIGHSAGENELVHVSALNQYLYCPRRYWYYRFYPPSDSSVSHVQGSHEHAQYREQSNSAQEQYLSSSEVGLRGYVDVIEYPSTDAGKDTTASPPYIPIERKRGMDYYRNDEVQLAGYSLLIEDIYEASVEYGYIYTRHNDTRHQIQITADHRKAVDKTIRAIHSLNKTEPPSLVEKPSKCRGCSVRHYCLPRLTACIDPRQASDRWDGVVKHE